MFIAKIPFLVRHFPSNLVWNFSRNEKNIYLTFDDGPTPGITNQVLDFLHEYKAKASFFCLGKNVVKNPGLFKEIIAQGHTVGNHTNNHLNGWKTKNKLYYDDIAEANETLQSYLFRPPYGRLRTDQIFQLKKDYKIIMWEVLSRDYSYKITPQECFVNVITNSQPGSIIVFHDSVKASKNLLYALPKVLEYYSQLGYSFNRIEPSLFKTLPANGRPAKTITSSI